MRSFTLIKNALLTLAFALICLPGLGQAPHDVGTVTEFPYNQNFSSTDFPPDGWQSIVLVGTGNWERASSGSNPTVTPLTGGALATYRSYSFGTGHSAKLVSPLLSIPGEIHQVRFTMFHDTGFSSSADRVEVLVNDNATLEGATSLGVIHRSVSQQPGVDTQGWHEHTLIIPAPEAEKTWDTYVFFRSISGYGNNIHIDAVNIEAAPTQPILAVNKESLHMGMFLPGEVSPEASIQLSNIGINILEINDGDLVISGANAADFQLVGVDYPIEIPAGQNTEISLTFSPAGVGERSANLQINHNGENPAVDIPLTGIGYEALDSFFEDFNTAEVPELPMGWNKIVESTSTSALVATTNFSSQNPVSPPNQVRMANSNDDEATILLISPKAKNFAQNWLTFYAYGNDIALQVGTMTDISDASTFVADHTITLTSAHRKYFVNLTSEPDAQAHVVFRHAVENTYQTIFIDNITWEVAPLDPVLVLTPTTHDFGSHQTGTVSEVQEFTLTNHGSGLLTIAPEDITIQGADAQDFTLINLDEPVSLALSETATFSVAFSPVSVGEKSALITILDNVDNDNPHEFVIEGTGFDSTLYPPFVVDFIGDYPPLGWNRMTGQLTNNSTHSASSRWSHDKFGNVASLPENNSARMYVWMGTSEWATELNEWLITPIVSLGEADRSASTVLNFDMALTPWTAGDTSQKQLSNDDYFAIVASYDNGQTWSSENVIYELDATHTFDNTRPTYSVDIDHLDGNVMFAFFVRRTTPHDDVRMFITNVGVTNAWDANFTVSDETGPVENAVITIDGISTQLITDASGQASINLPDGTYNYSVLAEDHIPFENGTLVVDAGSVQVPVSLETIVYYTVTFNLTDTQSQTVANADINIDGQETITTNELGIATIQLYNGIYEYSINIYSHLPVDDVPFTVEGHDLALNVELTPRESFQVTFTVKNDNEPADMLEDARIKFTGINLELYTDASGIATASLPEGEYTYDITLPFHHHLIGQTLTVVDENIDIEAIMVPRPQGSTCDDPIVLSLPVVDYTGNTEIYGNDYVANDFSPPAFTMNGHDVVFEFTIDNLSFVSGSVQGSWTGIHLASACPEEENPVILIASDGSNSGGGFDDILLEEGSYYIFISTNPSPDFTDFTLNLSAEAVAADPVFEITPEEKDFGQVSMYTQASQVFTISNTGSGTLTIQPSDITITGEDASEFILDPVSEAISLETAETAQITVRFIPLSEGTKSAVLNIEDNIDGDIRELNTVALTGEAFDGSYSVIFLENFNSTPFPPADWMRMSGILTETPDLSPATGGWLHHVFGNTGSGNNSAYINMYSTKNHWLATPIIYLGDEPCDEMMLTFDIALTPWTGTDPVNLGPNDYFAVLISTDAGVTWSPANVLQSWDNTTPISNEGETVSISLAEYSGAIRVAFYAERPSGNNPDLRLYVDNVRVGGPDPTYTATFEVKDEEGVAITDAVVSFDGEQLAAGQYIIDEVLAGQYQWSVSREGFYPASGQTNITDADVTIEVVLEEIIPVYTVNFNITDTEGTLITEAVVTFDGQQMTAGEYVIEDVLAGDYPWAVNKDGYLQSEGTVSVTDQDVTVDVQLETIPVYTVTFEVKDESGADVTDAILTFDDVVYPAGTYIVDELLAGNYSWMVSKEGFNSEDGQVTITDNDVTVEVVLTEIIPVFTVTFNLKNDSGENVEGAIITFDGQELAAGTYVVEEVLSGTYNYSVEKEGYHDFNDVVVVIDSDITVNVVMEEIVEVFTVTFNVSDEQSEVISDAIITFDGQTYDSGEYVFTDIEAGTYSYAVNKEGHIEATGELTVVDADITVNVIIPAIPVVTHTVTFNVHMHNAEFDPQNDNVYITGTMLGWEEPGDDIPNQLMTPTQEDEMVYTITLQVEEGTHQYKYYLNEGWTGGEWDGGDNRSVEITQDMVINNIFGDITDTPVGIAEVNKVNINLFPNPASSTLNIVGDHMISEIRIIDMLGQTVRTIPTESQRIELDVNNLRNGVYLIQIHTSKGIETQRVQIRN